VSYLFHLLILINIYGILAISLYPLVSLTGLMSVAHAAFFGIGAYTTAIMSVNLGTPWFLNVGVGVVGAVIVSCAVSLPSARLHEDYFVIATFAFQMVVFSVLNNWMSVTRGPQGIPNIPALVLFGHRVTTAPGFVSLSFAILALSYCIVERISKSPMGRVLRAIREDEVFAQTLGKDTGRAKVVIFAVSAALAAAAGSVYAHYVTYIEPTAFTINESILVLLMVILAGGEKTWGPLVGSAVLLVIPELLRMFGLPSAIGANVRQIVYGCVLVILMMLRPRGVGTRAQ
jgi:branched-chain amino acid transport system permease protein